MKAPPLLEMKGIRKRFPGVRALDGVNLTVPAGKVLGLVGENGAGKTTLVKILAGEVRPDGGEIRIHGEPRTVRNAREARALGIALVHQEPQVLDNLDVAENVFIGREPARGLLHLLDRPRLEARTRVCLEPLGADLDPGTPVRALTLAQRQMVEIGRALSLEAQLLVLDEPTASLSPRETERLLHLIRALAARGLGLVFISHRLEEVRRAADRVAVLRDGRNAGELPAASADRDILVRLMVGRDLPPAAARVAAERRRADFRVRNLRTRAFPEKAFHLDATRGEILGLAGLVGAGRTEAVEAIFGVDGPLRGSVYLDDRRLSIASTSDAVRAGIFLVPEDRRRHGLVDRFTVRENLTLPALGRFARLGLVRRRKERRAADAIRASLDIRTPSLEQEVRRLSGGNQQKTALGKWLSRGKAAVFLFDEPTRGVDVGAKAEIHRIIRGTAEGGAVVIAISSDMEEVLRLSDRVAVMHEGTVRGVLERADATEERVMRLAVGGAVSAAAPAYTDGGEGSG